MSHRYKIFFVKDRVDKGELTMEYCPTYQMLGDYFTKPLQGSLFNKFRRVIMGYEHISTLRVNHEIKERVVNMNRLELNKNIISKCNKNCEAGVKNEV